MGTDCPSNLRVHAALSSLVFAFHLVPLSSWRLSPADVVWDGEGTAGSAVPATWECEGGKLGPPGPPLPPPRFLQPSAGTQRDPSLGGGRAVWSFHFPSLKGKSWERCSVCPECLALCRVTSVRARLGSRHSRTGMCFIENVQARGEAFYNTQSWRECGKWGVP